MPNSNVLELPPLIPLPTHAPLGVETERAWQDCFAAVEGAVARVNQKPASRGHWNDLKPLPARVVRQAFTELQAGPASEDLLKALFQCALQEELAAPIQAFWQRSELTLLHLVRFLIQVGALRRKEKHRGILGYGYWMEALLPSFWRTHPELGLRDLGAAFTAAGLDARSIGTGILESYHDEAEFFGLSTNRIWPYWADHLPLLVNALAMTSTNSVDRYYLRGERRHACQALATFPCPPSAAIPSLWAMALGPKTERPMAQRCLEQWAEKIERLKGALTGGSPESRSAAAEWFGRFGNADPEAIPILLAALKREKNESTKGAMMSALEQLGASVDQFLDREALAKDAEKGSAKPLPEDLRWFPFDQLPTIHWTDDAKPVAPAIVKWWLIQGFKSKKPEPGPLLRRYCGSVRPAERQALGQFVLDAWVAQDVSPISRAEAEKRAREQARQYVQWTQSSYWPQGSPKKTFQEYYEEFLETMVIQPIGSAVSSKGVLSVAAACAGAGAAPVVARYLKQWYGMRAAQCRALLQMLAWVEHKTATQLLLATGRRFRTRSIQEEANTQAAALAERKGWTVAELADRTIPTAGLDDDGALALDFGPRQFVAKLNEDLEFMLHDAEGKPIKSLPEPRKDDDEAKAAEAKKLFSSAKKELKSIIAMQRDRFYEAMCTQRLWPFEDWNTYLNRHPIARHLCQRLVWAVVRDDKFVSLMRPLSDGSLSGVDDEPMTVAADGGIRIAHECQVTPEQSVAWRNHFNDYDVEPLFEQFGRPNFQLAEDRRQEDELTDFRGHVLEAFKLRARANKLGYTRGQSQDGGWFYDYHKRFPTIGLEVILAFTGNSLPEENRAVALTGMSFIRIGAEDELTTVQGKLLLNELPAVLLSECWNDLRQIAAEGSGFDADWENKCQP